MAVSLAVVPSASASPCVGANVPCWSEYGQEQANREIDNVQQAINDGIDTAQDLLVWLLGMATDPPPVVCWNQEPIWPVIGRC